MQIVKKNFKFDNSANSSSADNDEYDYERKKKLKPQGFAGNLTLSAIP